MFDLQYTGFGLRAQDRRRPSEDADPKVCTELRWRCRPFVLDLFYFVYVEVYGFGCQVRRVVLFVLPPNITCVQLRSCMESATRFSLNPHSSGIRSCFSISITLALSTRMYPLGKHAFHIVYV